MYFLFSHFQLDVFSFSVGKPPKVVTAMKDVTVTMPKKASLQCDISPGEPRATVRWFKDAKEVYPSRKYDMSYKVSLQHQNCFPYPSIWIHFFTSWQWNINANWTETELLGFPLQLEINYTKWWLIFYYQDKTATLDISSTDLTDTAKYRCEADNKVGRADTEAKLTVHGMYNYNLYFC